MSDYKDTSFWFDTFFDDPAKAHTPRASLKGEIEADVAIIGAGYTGLWSAYYLKTLKPELSVVVLEAEIAGYGASGRNGGWVSGSISGLDKYTASLKLKDRQQLCRVLFDNVDQIGELLNTESIDADFNKAGVIYAAARFQEQLKHQQEELKDLYAMGFSEDDCYWLDKQQLAEKLQLRNGLGGIYKRHCATINPAKMVRGLAQKVEQLGVKIYEKTAVESFLPRTVTTSQGCVNATTIIPAVEGYASTIKGLCNYLIPVHSMIIATEPLSDSTWRSIGLTNREAFSDGSRMVTYGHRSADNRMIFGSRGGYNFGGKPSSIFTLADQAFRAREALLIDLFPSLKSTKITHGWGGSLGVARNFAPHVLYDKQTGIASAGGYGGEGVAASHLFARTLVDLVLDRESLFTQMPWVFNHQSMKSALRRWEPEPFRWVAAQAISKAYSWEESVYLKGEGNRFTKSLANHLSNTLSLLMR